MVECELAAGASLPKQAAIDRAHRAVDIAGGMNDRVEQRKRGGPALGRGDIAGQRRRAKFPELRRGGVGSRQARDIVSAPDEFAHHGGADRASAAEYENAHRLLLHNNSRFRPPSGSLVAPICLPP
jgi:hypothetical protein